MHKERTGHLSTGLPEAKLFKSLQEGWNREPPTVTFIPRISGVSQGEQGSEGMVWREVSVG